MDTPWRKNHIAVNVGQHMLIHGGLDDKDNVLNDCHLLLYIEMRWSKLDCRNSKSPYLAYHSCAITISETKLDNNGFYIYKPFESGFNHKSSKVKI